MMRLWKLLALVFIAAVSSVAQQAAPQTAAPPPVRPATPEFARAADEVLDEISRIIALPVKTPLRKSVRTRDEIRAYVLRHFEEDRDAAKRYADRRTLEKLGLIPKGFDLDAFLIELLTEQIAGLYDPKGGEFFIADWIEPADQKLVMAHELVHALQDQHFRLEVWLKAARPNDDAVAARDAVLEGSAIAGMMDYMLRGRNLNVRNMPDIEELVRRQMLGDTGSGPQFARAPAFIRDVLLFPYLAGTTFTQRVLRAGSGWEDFRKVFENPPSSTQHILHPDLYLAGVVPRPVALPDATRFLRTGWKRLDENLLGEFGLHGVLKEFLGHERAQALSPAWAGDRYAIYEQEKTKQLFLLFRLRLESEEATARFFGQYSELLERKYAQRRNLLRRPNCFSFASNEGDVFLYCVGVQCLVAEGAERRVFDRIVRAMQWPAAPTAPARPRPAARAVTTFR